MNGENKTNPQTVELSHAEVLAVLSLIEARFIPGLESAPGSEQASDQPTSDAVEGFESLQNRDYTSQCAGSGDLRVGNSSHSFRFRSPGLHIPVWEWLLEWVWDPG